MDRGEPFASVNTTTSPDCDVLTYSRVIFPDRGTLSAGVQADRTIITAARQPIEGKERHCLQWLGRATGSIDSREGDGIVNADR